MEDVISPKLRFFLAKPQIFGAETDVGKHIDRETGITVILVSHSMEDVAKYVDRIIVMNKGQIFLDHEPLIPLTINLKGTLESLITSSKNKPAIT